MYRDMGYTFPSGRCGWNAMEGKLCFGRNAYTQVILSPDNFLFYRDAPLEQKGISEENSHGVISSNINEHACLLMRALLDW